jgi:transposase
LLTLVLTPGQRHEAKFVDLLLSTGAVKRPGRGRPRLRPGRIVGDKGYCGTPVRDLLRRRGIRFTIAKKRNMCRKGPFDQSIYRQRNQIERTINRFKQFRRIATRYEKRAVNYHAMWLIAAIALNL